MNDQIHKKTLQDLSQHAKTEIVNLFKMMPLQQVLEIVVSPSGGFGCLDVTLDELRQFLRDNDPFIEFHKRNLQLARAINELSGHGSDHLMLAIIRSLESRVLKALAADEPFATLKNSERPKSQGYLSDYGEHPVPDLKNAVRMLLACRRSVAAFQRLRERQARAEQQAKPSPAAKQSALEQQNPPARPATEAHDAKKEVRPPTEQEKLLAECWRTFTGIHSSTPMASSHTISQKSPIFPVLFGR